METQAINLTAAFMAMGCLIFSLVVLYYRGPDAFLQAAREWISIIECLAAIVAAMAEGWGGQWATWWEKVREAADWAGNYD